MSFDLDTALANHAEDLAPPIEKVIEGAAVEDIPDILQRLSDEPYTETEKAAYVAIMAKRFKIPARTIWKDLDSAKGCSGPQGDQTQETFSAILPRLLDIVENDGKSAYLFKGFNGQGLKVSLDYEDEKGRFVPPPADHLPFPLVPAEAVIEAFEKEDKELFEDVLQYMKRFSFLPEKDFILLCLYAFLTYLQDHNEISYVPMILFYSVPERGKSRTGKSLTYICYRGSHRVDLRETNLFRDSENLSATLFLDIMDLWKKAERNESTDILLLRYERGARVARVLYPEKGPFKDTRHFSVFGPTIMASNEPIHKILGSRCIPFTMPNRPDRYEDPSPEKALDVRARLTAWRGRMLDVTLPDVQSIQEITGRLWDISRPLLMVAKVVCPDRYNEVVDEIRQVASGRAEEKRESMDGKIVQTLVELSMDPPATWEIPVSDVLGRINADVPDQWRWTSQKLGRRLKALSLETRKGHGTARIILNRQTLSILALQHGVEFSPSPIPDTNSPNSPKGNDHINTNTYGGDCQGRVENSDASLPRNAPLESVDTTDKIPYGESGESLAGIGNQEKEHKDQLSLFEV